MRQEKTKKLLKFWLELFWQAGNTPGSVTSPHWPERSEIEPARCRELLANMFILERRNQEIRYRLAGTGLCSLFGRELKQEAFSTAFADSDARAADNWVERLGFEDHLILLCSEARTNKGNSINLETLMLPLGNNGNRGERTVGITVPCDHPIWLGAEPIVSQSIKSVRLPKPWEENQNSFGVRPSITDAAPLQSRRTPLEAPSMFNSRPTLVPPSTNAANLEPENRRQVAHLTVIEGGLDKSSV